MKKLALCGLVLAALTLVAVTAAVRGSHPDSAAAASHREAPLISLDAPADNTDTYFFRSYEPGQGEKIVMVMNVLPGEEPSAGPNYYNFDPNVKYSFHIDNDQDGKANDVVVSFDFDTEIRGVVDALGLPVSYLGGVGPVPPITALDGPGSEGLGLRQRYNIQVNRGVGPLRGSSNILAKDLIAVPSNVGPKTMPNYDALAAQGIYDLGNGIKVFAGQRNDPFYIDLGATFDSLNFRRFPPLLTAGEDMTDNVNPFGFDQIQGFSVHTIAVEMPASMLTKDGKGAEATAAPKLGLYASTSRPTVTVRNPSNGRLATSAPGDTQVSRLANPLVNELIIGTKDKDEWNGDDPNGEEKFVGYYLKPRIALALQLAFGFPTGCTPFGTAACSPNPPAATDTTLGNFNRDDLVNVLLKYAPTDTNLSELLRLDVSVDPVPLAAQKRLSILAGDARRLAERPAAQGRRGRHRHSRRRWSELHQRQGR